MPELPEVEVVRRGLGVHAQGRAIRVAEVLSARTARRYGAGAAALAGVLAGRSVGATGRRGKYLWLELTEEADAGSRGAPRAACAPEALVVHLGMSGQLRVRTRRPGARASGIAGPHPAAGPIAHSGHAAAPHPHLRAYLEFAPIRAVHADGVHGEATRIEFLDQRTFGWWLPARFVEVDGSRVPEPVAHIARDPLDPRFDARRAVRTMRSKHTEVKRLLLDQTIVSGIGNIYADEALWRAGVHGCRAADALSGPALARILDAARAVMSDALAQGGTSFDSLYVNVNGESGYFSRSLEVYGREGLPCSRCGSPIRRETFMNRSSYSCPRCQVRPRYALR